MATRKLRPGSLPLPKIDVTEPSKWEPGDPLPSWMQKQIEKNRQALPPFISGEQTERERDHTFTALRQARAKAEELTGTLCSAAFEDWVRRCTVTAQEPSEWTQARTLYESYLAHAKAYGRTREQRAQSVLALATETQWGKMMGSNFIKKRRGIGWFYPLRLKQGA